MSPSGTQQQLQGVRSSQAAMERELEILGLQQQLSEKMDSEDNTGRSNWSSTS